MKPTSKNSLCYVALVVGLVNSGHSLAGDLNLSQQALELGTSAEPNVVIIMDDSGSMDWEVVNRDFAQGMRFVSDQPDGTTVSDSGGIKNRDSNDNGTANCTIGDGDFSGYFYGVEFGVNTFTDGADDCNTADDQAWRFRNHNYNIIYFDPAKEYKPWQGTDKNGNLYTDASITAAYADPYDPYETINLTTNNSDWAGGTGRNTSDRDGDGVADGFRYYTWEDLDGDGFFDNGEETEHLIREASAEVQQNFANWFQYWRSRDLIAKGAFSEVIAGLTNMRVGYTTINSSSYNFEVSRMNPLVTVGDKKDLLDNLFATRPDGGTPLRTSLESVGKYFACENGSAFGDTSNYTCPVEAAPKGTCQQNYAVLMTDGFWNGNSPSVGNADAGGSQFAGNTNGGFFADSYSNTLADVAMYYYENDLSSLSDSVNVTPIDVERSDSIDDLKHRLHQHMATYTVSFGVTGNLNGFPTSAGQWPNPGSSDQAKIDDLMHAAYNGRGEYYSATNPQDLVSSLTSAFESISQSIGASSAVAFNTQDLRSGSRLYRAIYNTQTFSGDLQALDIGVDGSINIDSPVWSAAEALDDVVSQNGRVIITYDAASKQGVEFTYADIESISSINTPLSADPPSNPPGSYGSILENRIKYIRGDSDFEGEDYEKGEFRQRESEEGRLGDMINSTPVFVGQPPFSRRDSEPYPTGTDDLYSLFKSDNESRREIVYIGANDGMLHGFDADDGKEVFAYVPSFLHDNLYHLTDPEYTHRMYVDASPTIADVFMQKGVGFEWRTLLIGGARAGGKGYFALDVTDPTVFTDESKSAAAAQASAKDIVMWEFTDQDDDDLGYTFSRPAMVMSNAEQSGKKRWVSIFGNGYNSSSADGDAALFILFVEEGMDGDWTNGYVKISTGIGKAESTDGATPNGLGDVRAVDVDTNGTVDYVYAGDLQGNLYRFDLTSSNSNQWSSNNMERIFQARYGSNTGDIQPIINRPAVVRHETENGFIVQVGTGSWMTVEDAASEDIQSIYGIWDDLSNNRLVKRSDLVEQQFLNQGVQEFENDDGDVVNDEDVSNSTNNTIDWDTNDGWVIDLDMPAFGAPVGSAAEYPGERAIRRLSVRGGVLTGNTILPRNINSCEPSPGGFRFAVNPHTGGWPDQPVFDLNFDGNFNDLDNVGGGSGQADIVTRIKFDDAPSDTACLGTYCFTQLGNGEMGGTQENTGGDDLAGRLSWREVYED